MKKGKISIGTIVLFASIGLLRSCQDYNLNKQLEADRINQITNPEITFEEIFTPARENVEEELHIDYKK